MLKSTKILGIMLVTFVTNVTIGQCPTPEKLKVVSKTKGTFGVNSQSKTGSLMSGQSYEMSFIAQDGYDYRVTAGTIVSGKGNVSFEIYEMISEKDDAGKYVKSKKVIISSEEAESNTLEFTTDKARKLMIKVNYEEGDEKKPECVGVLIEDKKTTKIGL